MTMSNGTVMNQFGDTTLTKVFVGGLAWETPKEVMKEHFDKYGEILEAVIISDKLSGRSKGYGFVTFKESEAAKKACEEATPVINGRRANCNLASLGARRPRSTSTPPPPPQRGPVHNVGPRSVAAAPASNHVQWYYSPAATAATPALPYHHPHQQHHHHHLQAAAMPYYGYSPSYIATDHVNYNHKLGYTNGSYMNGHYSQMYLGQPMMGPANTLMPIYPFYHFHQSQAMGLPAHYYSPGATATISSGPALMSKPTSIPPNPVCLIAE